jgi:hypothetical protein
LRQQIDRLHLWDKEPHIRVDTFSGYFTQYLYMPRVRNHDVVRSAISHLNDVLLPEQDGFAYADSRDDEGRYRGLVLHENPTAVSNSGLVVDPNVAEKQIDSERQEREGVTEETDDRSTDTETDPRTATRKPVRPQPDPRVPTQPKVTRFHGTKALDPTRAVRDISQISDEILALFTVNDVPLQLTVDIESSAMERLTPDQVTALKENLNTLGFTDWSVE